MAYKTIADFFDPVGLAMQAAQIKAAQQQEQQAQMQAQLMQQKIAAQQQQQQFSANPQIMTTMPGTQATPDTQALNKQLQNVATMAQKAIATGNGPALNRINASVQSNPQLKQHMQNAGLGNIEIGQDPKTKDWYQIQTKNWTRKELDALAEKYPGAKVLASLPEGDYSINFDPVNKTVRSFSNNQTGKTLGGKSLMDDTNLTDTDLIKFKNYGTPEEQKQAEKILEDKQKYSTDAYNEKYSGGATDEDYKTAAEVLYTTGKMLPLGRTSFGRIQVLKQLRQLMSEKGVNASEMFSEQSGRQSEAKALQDITKRGALISTFTNRIEENSNIVKDMAKKYNLTDQRWLNVPINKLRGIMGSGDLQSFKLAIKSLSNEIAKVESGSIGISEVSVDQAKYMEKIHDINLSYNDLMKVIDTGLLLGQTAKKSINDQKMETRKLISGKKKSNDPRFVIETVE